MMNLPERFTYPFAYAPHPLVREAAEQLIDVVSSSDELRSLFSEGKMLGVLIAEDPEGRRVVLNAFSGLAGGRSSIPGFVPPIFDIADPDGFFRKGEKEIEQLSAMIPHAEGESLRSELSARRKFLSEELQRKLFSSYQVSNARGESSTVLEIFSRKGKVPPGGTGDCALPKLLQEAYRRGLRPRASGEFWYGASCGGEVRKQGCFYPACTGKCGPLLEFMLQGLETDPNPMEAEVGSAPVIVFEDDWIVVADKPAGMLSVPGRIEADSLLVWLQRREREKGSGVKIYSCHRLDMDTSGVMVFAKSLTSQAMIQRQFEDREVEKSYVALLSCSENAAHLPHKGCVDLPIAADYYDRPRQIVDPDSGKPALTAYEVLSVNAKGETLVRFIPRTGRTHQLRVHSAHVMGLGRPIVGDRLYGGADFPSSRLHLHAESLSFIHPQTGKRVKFSSPPDF